MRYSSAFILVLFLSLIAPWSSGVAGEVPDKGGAGVVAEGAEEVVIEGADENEPESVEFGWLEDEEYVPVLVADPLEPVNRIFFNLL